MTATRISIAVLIGLVVSAALLLAAPQGTGDSDADFRAFAPAADVAAAEKFVAAVRTGDFSGARAQMDPSAVALDVTVAAKIRALIPQRPVARERVTGWQTRVFDSLTDSSQNKSTTFVGLRYIYTDGSAVQADITLTDKAGRVYVYRANFKPLTVAEIHAYDFNLSTLSTMDALYLGIAVLLDTFAIATFVLCAMGPLPRWRTRWLWMIASLIGVIDFHYALRTGQTQLSLLTFSLPPGTIAKPNLDSPWVLTLSIPVGAILYWARRATWHERAAAAAAATNLSEFGDGGMRG